MFALSKTVRRRRPKLKTLKIKLLIFQMFPFWNRKEDHMTARKTMPAMSLSLNFKKFLFFRIKETVFVPRWFWKNLHN